MTNILTIPVDPTQLKAAHAAGILKQGGWGDGTHAVCMMSALVPGAKNSEACVTAGWPDWLVSLNISMFDRAETPKAAWEFAHAVATACTHPIDFDAARDRFMIAVLTDGNYSASDSLRKVKCQEIWWHNSNKAVDTVAALLTRRLVGEDVTHQLTALADAARAAAAEAWDAAARVATAAARAAATANAAARVATAAARAAATANAAAKWAAAWAARRAADAAAAAAAAAAGATAADEAARTAADEAARTAYRAHLVNALINSCMEA